MQFLPSDTSSHLQTIQTIENNHLVANSQYINALQQKPDDLTVYEEFSEFPFWGMFVMVIPTLGCRPIGTKAVKRRQIKDMDYLDIIIMSS